MDLAVFRVSFKSQFPFLLPVESQLRIIVICRIEYVKAADPNFALLSLRVPSDIIVSLMLSTVNICREFLDQIYNFHLQLFTSLYLLFLQKLNGSRSWQATEVEWQQMNGSRTWLASYTLNGWRLKKKSTSCSKPHSGSFNIPFHVPFHSAFRVLHVTRVTGQWLHWIHSAHYWHQLSVSSSYTGYHLM